MLLNVVEIEKYYGTRNNLKKALDRVSFSVNSGDFVSIMGASGSGKKTQERDFPLLHRPRDGIGETLCTSGQL